MGATSVLLLPYPEPSDPADVPTDMNELATRIETVRGAANGLASLGADGKVPAAQLPAGTGPTITTSALSGGPPASPADGDIWIAHTVGANGERWMFQYNAGSASTYKWEFIGGPDVAVSTTGGSLTSNSTWQTDPNLSLTTVRGGDYLARLKASVVGSSAGSQTVQAGLSLSGTPQTTAYAQFIITQAGFSLSTGYDVRVNARPAGNIMGPAWWNNSTGAYSFGFRTFAITPIRVA